MAIDKYINIHVVDGDVEKATQEVEALGHSVEKVEKNSEKAGKSVESGFEGASSAANNLKGGVEGVAEQIVVVGKAAKTSGKAMKSALISTGIGAFIVLLGLVIDNWESIQDFIDGSNKSLQRRIDLLKESIKISEHELELLDLKEKILVKEGKSTKEIREQKRKIILIQQEQNLLLLDSLQTQLLKETAQIREVTLWEKIKIATLNAAGAYNEAGKAAANALFGDEEQEEILRKIEKQIEEAQIRQQKLRLKLLNINSPDKKKNREKETALDGLLTSEEQQERIEKLAEQFEEVFDLKKMQDQQLIDAGKSTLLEIANNEDIINAKRAVQEEEFAKIREEIAEEEAQNKIKLAQAVGSGLSSLGDIVGRETAAGKALAVAGALIDTYAAIAKTLKAHSGVPVPGYAIAQSIATGLAGFAAVKNILKVKVPNFSGGSAGGNTSFTGGAQASTPSFNVIGQGGVNQLAQTLNQDQAPIRAYMVTSEVSSNIQLERQIEVTATID